MIITKGCRYSLVSIVLLLLTLGACSGSSNADTAWLLGQWELSHNPENDDEDVLVFERDGKFHVQTVDGRTLPGQYVVEGGLQAEDRDSVAGKGGRNQF